TTTPGATSYSASNGRSWLRYNSTNRSSADRSTSGIPPKVLREKSGDAQNSTSGTARWIGTSGRSRPLSPSASSPPTWSTCRWVSTTSVTDSGSMPAAPSRRASSPPARGKSGYSAPSPASMSTVRPPLRTTTTFSGHLNTSGGSSLSSSQAASSAGSALVANVAAGSGNAPSLTTSTSILPTRSA